MDEALADGPPHARGFTLHAGLLPDFPTGGFLEGFAGFVAAARERPRLGVPRVSNQQHTPLLVGDAGAGGATVAVLEVVNAVFEKVGLVDASHVDDGKIAAVVAEPTDFGVDGAAAADRERGHGADCANQRAKVLCFFPGTFLFRLVDSGTMDLETVGRFLAGPAVAWLGSGLITRPLRDPTGMTTLVVLAALLPVVGIPLGVAFTQHRLYLKRTVWFVFVANFASLGALFAAGMGLRLFLALPGVGIGLEAFYTPVVRLFWLALSVLSAVVTYRLLFDEEETLRVREETQSS